MEGSPQSGLYYRRAGNFRGGLIFADFVGGLQNTNNKPKINGRDPTVVWARSTHVYHVGHLLHPAATIMSLFKYFTAPKLLYKDESPLSCHLPQSN